MIADTFFDQGNKSKLTYSDINSLPELIIPYDDTSINDIFDSYGVVTSNQLHDKLHNTIDASVWAAEFRQIALGLGYSDMDEGWLIGWFANAIMTGWDFKYRYDEDNNYTQSDVDDAWNDGIAEGKRQTLLSLGLYVPQDQYA